MATARLAGRRELRDGAARRRLRRLAAGVRVHLGVEHEHVDVAARRQHVVEPAEADVVGPAVAADDPHAAAHQVVGQRSRAERQRPSPGRRAWTRASATRRLRRAARRAAPSDRRRGSGRRGRRRPRPRAVEQHVGLRGLGCRAEAHAEPELGVVLEQRVGPGRPAAFGVRRPRRRRQVAAVDRRAAGGVGDQHPVAEQLASRASGTASRRSRRTRRRTRTAARAPASP